MFSPVLRYHTVHMRHLGRSGVLMSPTDTLVTPNSYASQYSNVHDLI